MKTCDHILKVHASHDGELPANQIAEVEAHVRGCETCAAELAWLQKARIELRSTLTAKAPSAASDLADRVWERVSGEPYKPVLRLAWGLTAAAAAILLASMLQLHWMQSTQAESGPLAALDELADPRGADPSFAASDEQRLARWMVDDLSGSAGARGNQQ